MSRGHGDKLSDLMIQKAIAALLRSSCLEEAAQLLGIHRATLWRWQQLPKFRRAYKEVCQQLRKSNVADYLDDLKRKPEPALSR
jgi:Helix-turn-helix of insertion element transposase